MSPLSSCSGEDPVTCNGLGGQGELGRTQKQNNMAPVVLQQKVLNSPGLVTNRISCVRLSKG